MAPPWECLPGDFLRPPFQGPEVAVPQQYCKWGTHRGLRGFWLVEPMVPSSGWDRLVPISAVQSTRSTRCPKEGPHLWGLTWFPEELRGEEFFIFLVGSCEIGSPDWS